MRWRLCLFFTLLPLVSAIYGPGLTSIVLDRYLKTVATFPYHDHTIFEPLSATRFSAMLSCGRTATNVTKGIFDHYGPLIAMNCGGPTADDKRRENEMKSIFRLISNILGVVGQTFFYYELKTNCSIIEAPSCGAGHFCLSDCRRQYKCVRYDSCTSDTDCPQQHCFAGRCEVCNLVEIDHEVGFCKLTSGHCEPVKTYRYYDIFGTIGKFVPFTQFQINDLVSRRTRTLQPRELPSSDLACASGMTEMILTASITRSLEIADGCAAAGPVQVLHLKNVLAAASLSLIYEIGRKIPLDDPLLNVLLSIIG